MAEGRSRAKRERSKQRSTPFRGAALGLSATLVMVAPQLAGGRPAWGVVVIAALAGATAIAVGLHARRSARLPLPQAVPLLAALAALAWTAIQCVPLPMALARVVDPWGTADAVASAALAGDDAPAYWTLARSPWPCVEEVLKGAALVAAFATGWWLSMTHHREHVLRWAGLSTLAMAVAAVGHELADAHSVYGLYTPWMMGAFASPLVNENHLAGFLAMGVPLLVALGAEEHEERRLRAAWWSAAAIVAGTCVLAISRGGLVGLGVGLVALLVLRVRARDPRERGRNWSWILGAIALLVGLSVAATVAFDELERDLSQSTFDKVRLALRGLDLVGQSPWTGVGRGGYSEAFVRLYGTSERAEHPELFLVQWASEWGLPVTLGLVIALARAWWRAASTRSVLHMGALAAVLSVAVHELVDFMTECLGVAVVVAMVLGAALSTARRDAQSKGRSLGARTPVVLGAVAVACALLLGPGLGARRGREIEHTLVEALEAGDTEAFDRELARAMRMHPSEPTFPLLGGYARLMRRETEVGRWLNRAMILAPGWSSPHLIAAQWLAAGGRYGQAWLEVREAETLQEQTGRALACELAIEGRATDEALRVFAAQPDVLDRLAACPGLPSALAARIDDTLLSTPLAGPRLRSANRAMASAHCEEAIAVLEPAADDAEPMIVLRLAQVYERCSRAADTIALLDRHPIEPWANGDADIALAHAHADLGDADGMRAAVDRLRGAAHGSGARIADTLILLGTLEHQLHNDGHAMRAFDEAARLAPESAGMAEVAALAESLGDRTRAYQAYSQVCHRDGPASPACAAASRLRGD